MSSSQAHRERLDRLAGDGTSVVGIDLAALFRVILNQLQDSADPVPAAAFAGPARDVVSNHARIGHLYGDTGDPWTALIGDALSQLESRALAVQEDGGWRPGSAFVTGKRVIAVPGRKGKHGSVGLILYPAGERAVRGEVETRRMEITSLGASLREDGPGLRPLNPEHVDALAQSMRDHGYRPEFPVLADQHGRILDGRHRRAAARKAGLGDPPVRVIRFDSDEDALGFALLVNVQRGWTKTERGFIDRILQTAGLNLGTYGQHLGAAAKRERIRGALLASPKLSHNAVAKRLGYANSGPMIKQACDSLIIENIISECRHRLTEDGKQAPGPKPKLEPGESAPRKQDDPALQADIRERVEAGEPLRIDELAAKHRVGFGTVQLAEAKVRGRLEVRRPETGPVPAAAPASEVPSWQIMAELFRQLPDSDQASFLDACGLTRRAAAQKPNGSERRADR